MSRISINRPISGGLKRPDSARKRSLSGIRWDEHNLEENERIKASLITTKINEPKTPYIGPLSEEAMEDDHMQPLALDDGHHAGPSSATRPHSNSGGTATMPAAQEVAPGASAAAEAPATGPTAPAAVTHDAGGGAAPMDVDGDGGAHQHQADRSAGSGAGASGGHGASTSGGSDGGPDALLSMMLAGSSNDPPLHDQWHPDHSGFSSDSEYQRPSLSGMSEEEKRKFQKHRRAHYDMREALRRAKALLSEDGEGEDEVREGTSTSGADSSSGAGGGVYGGYAPAGGGGTTSGAASGAAVAVAGSLTSAAEASAPPPSERYLGDGADAAGAAKAAAPTAPASL